MMLLLTGSKYLEYTSSNRIMHDKDNTVGELKIDRYFGVNISAPRCAKDLKLMALDLSGPQVVASQF